MKTVYNYKKEGFVLDVCDGIVSVSGIGDVSCGELLKFQSINSDITGFAWNLEDDVCKVPIITGDYKTLEIGDRVYCTHHLVNTKCGFGILGEVINPLGELLLDTESDYRTYQIAQLFKTSYAPLESKAPGIIDRAPVATPLMTGMVSIDCFIPIGCGQRESIIGDQNAGKTSLAITIIINQGYINNDICGF